jgi:hypothetical protein
MIRWLIRQFGTMSPDPALLDHVPVNTREASGDERVQPRAAIGEGLSHAEKLRLAAERSGKPFACAADGLPRKVIKDGIDIVIGAGQPPLPEPPPANVASIRKARSA